MSHFNEIANEWDTPERAKEAHQTAELIKAKLAPLKNLKVLDLGCGTGLLTFHFLDEADSILGLDNSEGMLEVFNQKAKDLPQASARNFDLEKEPLNEKFDLILTSFAFHHLVEPQQMFKKFSGMLNPGGHAVIVDLDKEDGTFHPDNAKMGVKHYGFAKHDLESWCDSAGFNKCDHQIIRKIAKNDRNYPVFMLTMNKA